MRVNSIDLGCSEFNHIHAVFIEGMTARTTTIEHECFMTDFVAREAYELGVALLAKPAYFCLGQRENMTGDSTCILHVCLSSFRLYQKLVF